MTRLLGEASLAAADEEFLAGLCRWVEEPLSGCTPGAVREATIVLGELVANAYRHAEPPFQVRLTLPEPGTAVRLEVHDGTASPATGWALGRGLHLVRGLCPDWGVEHRPDGKAVWAELPVLVPPAPAERP
jgi:hypothetical protein